MSDETTLTADEAEVFAEFLSQLFARVPQHAIRRAWAFVEEEGYTAEDLERAVTKLAVKAGVDVPLTVDHSP